MTTPKPRALGGAYVSHTGTGWQVCIYDRGQLGWVRVGSRSVEWTGEGCPDEAAILAALPSGWTAERPGDQAHPTAMRFGYTLGVRLD